MTLAVIGAGAFGTALAVTLAGPTPVTLLGRNTYRMRKLQEERAANPNLPGVTLPPDVVATTDPDALNEAGTVLLCVPMQDLSTCLDTYADLLCEKDLIACCKGVDMSTLKGPVDLISAKLPTALVALLTGPSFADDIARGLPTALTLACRDPRHLSELQLQISRPALRLYRSEDVTGAQLGGALKNVIAIAAGACVGAGLGESARAALITRGFAEMQKLALALGAHAETLAGLSGLGDLILTCSSAKSRNFSYGEALGRGAVPKSGITVEGIATARAVVRLAAARNIEMPITQAVAGLVTGALSLEDAMQTLLSRPLTSE